MFDNEYTWGNAVKQGSEDEFDSNFEKSLEAVKQEVGQEFPIIINGKEVTTEKKFEVKSPSDTRKVLGTFQHATKEDTISAINSAKESFSKWSNTPYKERAQIFKDCADLFSIQKFELAAIMSLENGKNRLEAMGDIDEAIDFLRFYAYQLEKNEGFCKQTQHPNPNEKTTTVLKPYGVWGIISPFNFPSAISIGMTTGALITGNTVVLKPASDTPISSFKFVKAIYKKLPDGAINFITGSGSVVGQALIESPDVDGIAFTGSKEVGMSGFRKFTEQTTKPFISETGGKNPVIVTKNADLEKAANGVMRAAFGYGGQKCSACSRVYVQDNVAEEFISKLVEKTKKIKIGLPWEKDVFLGPVINNDAVQKFENASKLAKKDAKILTGGSVINYSEYEYGYFVEPTIVTNLPRNHQLTKEELFLPFLCIETYSDFEDAIKLANSSEFGLTAGIFSEDKKQLDEFFDKIHAGTIYANREASATTGALVRVQPFVGWKNSGSTGKAAGGENYLQQFMRAQTQTRCD